MAEPRGLPPHRPPLRVDPRGVRRLGGARHQHLRRLHAPASCRSGRRTPRPAHPRRWRCSSDEDRAGRPLPRRADRRLRLRQEHVRGPSLPAHGDRQLRLLPRARGRRPQRPGRDQGRVRGAARDRVPAARPRPADGHRRHQRPEGGPRAARADRPRARPVRGRDRHRHARGDLPGAQRHASGPRLRRARHPPPDARPAPLAAPPAEGGLPLHARRQARRRGRDRPRAAVGQPRARVGPVRHRRRHPRLPRRAAARCSRSSATPRTVTRTGGARSSSATTATAGPTRRTSCAR